MKQVLFIPEVRKYFENLVPLLYEMDYFSYLDKSQKYVKELIDDIVANLPTKLHKPAPAYFDQYGTNMQVLETTDIRRGMSFLQYTGKMAKRFI